MAPILGIGIGKRTSFVPTDLAGCVLWLRADLGITLNGPNVAAWADQSGAGNDFSQGTASKQPLYDAGAIGGKPALLFEADDAQYLQCAAMADPGALDLFLVLQLNADPPAAADSGLVAFGVNTAASYYPYVDGLIYWDIARTSRVNSVAHTQNLALAHSFETISDGVSYDMLINGASIASVAAGYTWTYTTPLIGAAGQYLDGHVAEVIAYSSRRSAGERTLVNAYLAAGYGL